MLRRAVIATLCEPSNPGALLQAACMAKLLGGTLAYFDRQLDEPAAAVNVAYRDRLPLSPRFTDSEDAAEWINDHASVLVVGSDEAWKINPAQRLVFPSHYFGCGVTVPMIAMAACTSDCGWPLRGARQEQVFGEALRRFDRIYTRDRNSADQLRQIGVPVDGQLPDPTFAFSFSRPPGPQVTGVTDLTQEPLPNSDALSPPEWFSAHGRLECAVVDRMHPLLACLRSGTPCLVRDRRSKTAELVADFRLPEDVWGDDIEAVKRQWPYLAIAERCEAYKARWQAVLAELRREGILP